MKNKIMRRIILIIIVIFVFYIGYEIYKESKIRSVEESGSIIQIEKVAETKTIVDKEESAETKLVSEKEKINVPKTYLGFEVAAELIIPKIDLKTNVLKNYTKNAMDTCATKFWGPEPNEIGNFCIVGHNYEKENMFYNLIDIEIGDEMYLLDNKNGKVTYKVYDIYKVKPENTDSLRQDTEGKRIITLITCVNYSNKRLIVQAIET